MTIIIVGADEVGIHLVELAVSDGIDLVVEEDSERADTVSSKYDCPVTNDDPASLKTLEKAAGERTNALIASTSSDEITSPLAC